MAGTAMGAPLAARAQPAGPAEFVIRGGKVLTMSGNRVAEAEACFRFLPTRAKLDLMGWPEEDIFAHS